MSKIFEAIRKTEGELAAVASRTLGSAGTAVASHPMPRVASRPSAIAESLIEEADAAAEIRMEAVHVAADSPLLPFDGLSPRAAEQYKIIRTKIMHYPTTLGMVMLSSPMPGDGKTVTAINLAAALSLQDGVRILLVDADFRRASLSKALGWQSAKGLSEVLRGEVELDQALIRMEQFPNLYVLPAGNALANPAELMATSRYQTLCAALRQDFRLTVFDAPPVGTVADYDVIQAAVDGVVLVVRPDHTDRGLCRQAFDTVPKQKQIGVILNCAEEWLLWKTNSYYYYGSNS